MTNMLVTSATTRPLPKGWLLRTIESLCTRVTSGGTPSRKNPSFYNGGTILWVKSSELKDWYVHDTSEKITECALESSSAKRLPKDTILMALYGDGRTITSLGLLASEATCNQACCAMICDKLQSDARFVFYSLKYHRQELLSLASGASQRNLSGKLVRSFPIAVPPLQHQKLIARILSAYDDLIENNTRRIAVLEEIAQTIYREWFVNFRFPGYEKVKFVESALGSIPDGWKATQWGELATLEYGKGIRGYEDCEKEFPVFGTNGPIGHHDSPLCQTSGVIIGRKGAYRGVHYSPKPFWVIDTAFFLKPKRDEVDVLWSYYHLLQVDINGMDSGSAIPSTSRDAFYALKVVLPSPGVAHHFQEVVGKIRSQIEVLKKSNANLRKTRDLLLPKLISGQLDVEQLDIEGGSDEVIESDLPKAVVSVERKSVASTQQVTGTPYKDDAAILCVLVDALQKAHRPTTEFVVQKHAFALKHLHCLPINSQFVSQQAGPWSQELRRKALHAGDGSKWLHFDEESKSVRTGTRLSQGLEYGKKILGERYDEVAKLVGDLVQFGNNGLERWMTIFKVVCDLRETGAAVTSQAIQKGIDNWPGKREKSGFTEEKVEIAIQGMLKQGWFTLS
jgi:type I restriction enzyme S subunit